MLLIPHDWATVNVASILIPSLQNDLSITLWPEVRVTGCLGLLPL